MNVEAYILVGGKSKRFGSDKALAKIDGITLAERARNTLLGALPNSPVFFIAGESGSVAGEARRLNMPVISDQIVDRGPVGGLHAALVNAKSEWVFLFACDLPMMTSGFISGLLDECSDEVDAVLPEQPDGRFQPLCAFYRVAAALSGVEKVIDSNPNAAMMAVIDRLKARIVRPEESADLPPDIWTNVNRREDLDEIARKLSHRESI